MSEEICGFAIMEQSQKFAQKNAICYSVFACRESGQEAIEKEWWRLAQAAHKQGLREVATFMLCKCCAKVSLGP